MSVQRTVTPEVVAATIGELLSIPVERIRPETPLDELVLDSFALVETAIELQEEFDVVFNQDDLKAVRTVGDLVALMQART